MDFAMNPTTIGCMLALNVVAVASSAILRPFKIYDWTFGKDVPPYAGPRIYNGMEAEEGQFKFMIFTLISVGQNVSLCSSSLVSPRWVLTAAHCLDHPHRGEVIITGGRANLVDYISERMVTPFEQPLMEKTYGVQERWAKRIYIHPDYNDNTYEHDVALIRTNRPFVLGETVTTIPLSTQKMTSRKTCTILGWGLVLGNIMPYKLNYVVGKEVSTTELGCVTEKSGRFICLKPDLRGICRGDSGSPLVCEGKVWGVASHLVAPQSLIENCGSQTEEFYTDIYYDLEWILGHINSGHVSSGINLKSLISCLILSFWISLKV